VRDLCESGKEVFLEKLSKQDCNTNGSNLPLCNGSRYKVNNQAYIAGTITSVHNIRGCESSLVFPQKVSIYILYLPQNEHTNLDRTCALIVSV
jgi:hypothetical protein